ncbi:hypothetical protein BIV57_04435 [Mangrovactinospora gilvigrisea]|uniref:Uncharacterized protein n=1 Tax=Mangrovactinospora gilvigrisea TaxID=1428644 RepID=A0A1J7CAT9_9ACTN|nr:hypothetical protein [Mangrovactinospora gilvigrisea]OIV38644.1 hypothetical protein BIV57_04435 [Mangrovactinospora gilvigrisea]
MTQAATVTGAGLLAAVVAATGASAVGIAVAAFAGALVGAVLALHLTDPRRPQLQDTPSASAPSASAPRAPITPPPPGPRTRAQLVTVRQLLDTAA